MIATFFTKLTLLLYVKPRAEAYIVLSVGRTVDDTTRNWPAVSNIVVIATTIDTIRTGSLCCPFPYIAC